MIGDQEGALDAALRQLAAEVAPRLMSQAVADAEAEVKELIQRHFARRLIDSLVQAAPRHDAPERPPVTSSNGWYVYGITDGDSARLQGLSGVEGSSTETIDHSGLVAVVSEVIARQHAWGIGSDGEPDLEMLEPRVREHEAVLERILDHGAVLPMRFGTVYPSQRAVQELLTVHATEIGAVLSRLRGTAEWGLTVTWNIDGVLEAGGDDPAADESATTGRGYLTRQVTERARAQRVDLARRSVASELHESVRTHAVDSVVLRQHARRSGGDQQPLLRASYLVATAEADRFREAIVKGLEAGSGLGLDGELTGPWPPYTFADLELSGATS